MRDALPPKLLTPGSRRRLSKWLTDPTLLCILTIAILCAALGLPEGILR